MRRFFFYQLFLVTILSLAGCIHTGKIRGSDLTEVKIGMTKSDVIEKLGKPVNASANEKFEVYRYFEDRGRFLLVYHEFVFVDDKLKVFGLADNPDFRAKVEVISSPR